MRDQQKLSEDNAPPWKILFWIKKEKYISKKEGTSIDVPCYGTFQKVEAWGKPFAEKNFVLNDLGKTSLKRMGFDYNTETASPAHRSQTLSHGSKSHGFPAVPSFSVTFILIYLSNFFF